jgi:cell division protein FtsL
MEQYRIIMDIVSTVDLYSTINIVAILIFVLFIVLVLLYMYSSLLNIEGKLRALRKHISTNSQELTLAAVWPAKQKQGLHGYA